MVLQLTQDQILRLTPFDGTPPEYSRVIFLEDGANDSVTFKAGRLGSNGWRSDGRYYNAESALTAMVSSVALTNTPVEPGDRVIIISSGWGQGREATVVSYSGSSEVIVTFDGSDTTHSFRRWVTLSDERRVPKPEPVIDPEDLKLSQYWIDRIKTLAGKAKRKNNWCSEIDRLVQELLEPVLVKWTVEAVADEASAGFAVIEPDGSTFAWFKERDSADALVTSKNKKLTI